jgi:hypothetical protein
VSDTAFTNRYEIKYLVRVQRLEEIRDALSGFFEPDVHAGPGGGYYNYSIYFDSPHYDFYSEKREGNLVRIKPRIRLYRSEPCAPASNFYLELKGRYDRIVLKRRDRITRDIAETLLSSGPAALTDRDLESSVLGEFLYLQSKLNLSPCVTIRYRREPMNAVFYSNVRITFDTMIQSSLLTSLDNPDDSFTEALPLNWFMLELKYNDVLPRMLIQRLNALGLQQQSVSKVAVGLEGCYHDLRGTQRLA